MDKTSQCHDSSIICPYTLTDTEKQMLSFHVGLITEGWIFFVVVNGAKHIVYF